MGRQTSFVTYQPKSVLNKDKRANHLFWTRYSAYPYLGCQHGCAFCYCRERRFLPYGDPEDFAHVIKVKSNAADLLRESLRRCPVDPVFTADYQPAERKYLISRKMLEVCNDLGFPVVLLERSPLVLRDLDLIQSIHQRARAVVMFSIIAAPGSPHYEYVSKLEGLAPPASQRFKAMEKLAQAGIPTGICFMPVLPGLCDDDADLQNVIRQTADHGGSFVLAGGLTLSDQQREFYLRALEAVYPESLSLYSSLYPPGTYGPKGDQWIETALRVREHCIKLGLRDRMPRPIVASDSRTVNKRVVEALADKIYDMELAREGSQLIWLYRRAAWAVEDLDQDITAVYGLMGLAGLEGINDIGTSMAPEIARLIESCVNSPR